MDIREPILKTKIHIPATRPNLVSRPQLIAKILNGFQGTLTLVSAPAGFGKTTLLSQGAAVCKHPIAWVSLDPEDNEPVRFWAYVIAALQTLYPSLGTSFPSSLRAHPPVKIEHLLSLLINEIIEVPERFGLILDDFHTIHEPEIQKGLAFLIDNLPTYPIGMHLIISGRADLPVHLARLRGRGELTEIRSGDLRFTSEEAAAFLNECMQIKISAEEVAALDTHTEGWVTGLQMAAISMRGYRNKQSLGGTAAFIRNFTGSHRFILDYLIEEVLNQQTSEIENFLLQTSILEQMNADLCDHVTGQASSRNILLHLERENLFLIPLDDQRRWYRYHHLFADLLLNRLAADQKEAIAKLHLKASEWYEHNGMVAEAVGHALKAGDTGRVARLVKSNIRASLYHEELATILRWLQIFMAEAENTNPWIEISHAWTLFHLGRLDETEIQLTKLQETLDESDDMASLLSQAATIRAYIAAIRGEMDQTVCLTEQALALISDEDHITRGFVAGLLSSALRWQGELEKAAEASLVSLNAGYASKDPDTIMEALLTRGITLLTQGYLNEAHTTYQQILNMDQDLSEYRTRRLPIMDSAYRILSRIIYEWNDIENALRFIKLSVELSEQWGGLEGLAFSYISLAKILHTSRDTPGALKAIEKGKQAAKAYSVWFGNYAAAHQATLWLAQGNKTAAFQWAKESGLKSDGEPTYQFTQEYCVLARVLAAQDKLKNGLILIDKLLSVNEKAGAGLNIIQLLILKALILQQKGEEDLALATLARALKLAEPENYIRSFVDEGAPMAVLLQKAFLTGISSTYITKLLAVLKDELPSGSNQKMAFSTKSLVEPVSKRELEVLKLLDTPLTASEIAQQLIISPHTIRTHIKNLYSKLGVHNRLQAVDKAKELDLI